jgi:hypothetical protein
MIFIQMKHELHATSSRACRTLYRTTIQFSQDQGVRCALLHFHTFHENTQFSNTLPAIWRGAYQVVQFSAALYDTDLSSVSK